MSKYGSGASIKTVIESELAAVEEILERSSLTEQDRELITDSLKEMAYQWCTANATACALDRLLEKEYPRVYKKIMTGFLRSETYHSEYQKKMNETLPEWDEK